MENQYICPHCRGHLKVGQCIVFKIRNSRRERGLMMMHPEGDTYKSVKHPLFHSGEGDRIDFFCPICMQSLDASLEENLVQVLMIDSTGNEHKIFFSRISRDPDSYQVSSEDLIQYLGV
jgi:hypothetical protein